MNDAEGRRETQPDTCINLLVHIHTVLIDMKN